MAVVENRPFQSLSGLSHRGSPGTSDSGETIGHHERHMPPWPPFALTYPPTFDDDDCESVTSSMLTDRIPGLTRGSSIASSESAMQTDVASALQGGFVLESDDGVLTIPQHLAPDADLLCPFQILDCAETFSSIREFKIHVFSHFRGHPLPTSASCFLCENKYDQTPDDDSALAWNKMLGHMAYDHFRRGQNVATIRADFRLMRWMYDRKIISDHELKRTQICPRPTILPIALRRASEGSTVPEVPTPPLTASPTSSESSDVSSPSPYSNQAYITFAGSRAERRWRDSNRPIMYRHSRTMS